jgi:hypothetical protein
MLEAHRRLRRAAGIIADYENAEDRENILWMAWEQMRGLRADEFPEELQMQFDYLSHELSLRKGQELTQREIDFLLQKIRELELKWIELPTRPAAAEEQDS